MENGFSVNNNTYGQDAGALLQPKLSGVKKKTSEQKTDFKSVYAGELLNRGDRVSDRYALAQKRALRKILNQFEEDSKIDAETEGRSERVEVLKTNIAGNNHNLIDLDERREAEKEQKKEELDKEIEEAILSTVLQAVNYGSRTAVANLQSNVKSLIQDQVFLDVDLKGLKIDTEL